MTFTSQAQNLSLRLANTHISNDSLVFDIQAKSAAGGEYLQDLLIYLDYGTDAFGSNVVSNTEISYQFLTLLSGNDLVFSQPKYTVISSLDNTSSRYSLTINAAQQTSQGSSAFHNTLTTNWQNLIRISLNISNSNKVPQVALNQALMASDQFYFDASSANNIFTLNVVNDLNVYPLQTFDIIWDGVAWTGGTGTGGAPGSSDNALDMLVETDTTSPMPANATVNKLILLDSSVLNLGGKTLTITGEIIGSVDGRAINGTIELAGTAAQSVYGETEWEQLTINNSNGVSFEDGVQSITQVLTPTSGTLTTNGNLLIKATDASTYGQIAPGAGTVSGDVTMQMVISTAGWHNLASPIASMTLDDLEDDILINYSGNSGGVSAYQWNASTGDFVAPADSSQAFTGGWNIFINNNFIHAGGGVNGDGNLPVILDLTGTINDGNVSNTLGYYSGVGGWGSGNYGGGSTDGWNLIANPYASNIDWEVIDGDFSGSDYGDGLYIWRQDLNGGTGGYTTYSVQAGGTQGGANTIAPFQAFWVKLNNSNGASTNVFDFGDADRTVESPATLWKNQERLLLSITRNSDPDYRDEVVFVREIGFSLGRDSRGDIVKYFNDSPSVMNFFSITPDSTALSANIIDRSFHGDTAFLGVKSQLLENYTISIDENSFPSDFKVDLYDRKTGVTTDLLSKNYTFTNDTAFDEHRFDLIAVANDISVGSNEPQGQTAFRIRVENGIINVDWLEGLSPEVTVEVIDLAGRTLYSDENVSTYGPLQFQFKKPLNDISYFILRVIDEDRDMAVSEKFLY